MNLCPVTMDVHEKARLPHEETKENTAEKQEENPKEDISALLSASDKCRRGLCNDFHPEVREDW